MTRQFSSIVPSLSSSNIVWPTQNETAGTVSLQNQASIIVNIQYYVQTSVVVTAIIEWNIGTPFIGQIRQTALDRMDFAY